MQRPSWPRRPFVSTEVDMVENNVLHSESFENSTLEDDERTKQINTDPASESGTNSIPEKRNKSMRLGILDSSNSTSKLKASSAIPGPNKITSALNRARENANNVGVKASTMVEGAKLHAKLQIVAASLSASQMAASARESADNVASAAAASAAAVAQAAENSANNSGKQKMPRSALKGSRMKELSLKKDFWGGNSTNFNAHGGGGGEEEFQESTKLRIPPIVGSTRRPSLTNLPFVSSPPSIPSSSSSSSSSLSNQNSTSPQMSSSSTEPILKNSPSRIQLDSGKVWFTEKVKVYCYDPHASVQLPRFGSSSAGGLSLDAFLSRRPRPTYTALSREGKEGILTVPAPAIRSNHQLGHFRRKKKNNKQKNSKKENQVNFKKDENQSNENSRDASPHVKEQVEEEEEGRSRRRRSDKEGDETGGLWQGFVHQFLKSDKSNVIKQNELHEEEESVGGGSVGGGSSVGYDSEGSYSSSWFSDDSRSSRRTSDRYDSDNSHMEEELFNAPDVEDDEDVEPQVANDNQIQTNTIKPVDGESAQQRAMRALSSSHAEWKKLRSSSKRGSGGVDDDKLERRRQARDQWWQKVAKLSSGHQAKRNIAPSVADDGDSQNKDQIVDGGNVSSGSGVSEKSGVGRRRRRRNKSGEDVEYYSTDTDGSDWAGAWGSDSETENEESREASPERNEEEEDDDENNDQNDQEQLLEKKSVTSSSPMPTTSTSKVGAVARAMAEAVSEARLRSKDKKKRRPKLPPRSWRNPTASPWKQQSNPSSNSTSSIPSEENKMNSIATTELHEQTPTPMQPRPEPPSDKEVHKYGMSWKQSLTSGLSLAFVLFVFTSIMVFIFSPMESLRRRGVLP